jgi:hypothetical protein
LVAIVFGTCILVITILEGVYTSVIVIARVISARIVVVTIDCCVNTSFDVVARIFCAFASIRARSCSMNTQSGVGIARIEGTCVVVVAADVRVDAFSRVHITRNSFA